MKSLSKDIFIAVLIVLFLNGCSANIKNAIRADGLNLGYEVKKIREFIGEEIIELRLKSLNIITNADGTIATIIWEIIVDENGSKKIVIVDGIDGHYGISYDGTFDISLSDSIPIEKALDTIQEYGLGNIFLENTAASFVLAIKSHLSKDMLYSNLEQVYVTGGKEIQNGNINSNGLYMIGLYHLNDVGTGREYLFELN
ncbi:hypothetical protein AAC978_03040 [Desulfitobacterium sp. THU1]|uniref:hypothetical protein n=1 Tax=Desulfitobacterium sp. THU1 TaxID=3138072 RepID=UPI00311FDF1A